MLRTASSLALASMLALGCAQGVTDEDVTSSTAPPEDTEPVEPARPVGGTAPASPGTASKDFDDPAGDATDGGADIRRVTVSQDRDAMLEIVVEVTGVGDLDLYVDSDLSDATGPDGFDVRFSAHVDSGRVGYWTHDGGAWTADSPPTFTASYANGKLVVRIHRAYLGPLGSRGAIGVAVGASGDRAPDGSPEDRYVYTPL